MIALFGLCAPFWSFTSLLERDIATLSKRVAGEVAPNEATAKLVLAILRP